MIILLSKGPKTRFWGSVEEESWDRVHSRLRKIHLIMVEPVKGRFKVRIMEKWGERESWIRLGLKGLEVLVKDVKECCRAKLKRKLKGRGFSAVETQWGRCLFSEVMLWDAKLMGVIQEHLIFLKNFISSKFLHMGGLAWENFNGGQVEKEGSNYGE